MKLATQTCCAVLALAAWTAAGAPASAHNPVGAESAGELGALAEQSNLVIRGRVAKVEYKLSEPGEGEGALPFTIVTYQIGDVLRGKPSGETFTMRFVGGSDGMGGFLEVSGVPQFEEGDEDLLFISGSGEQGCPLVLCEWGRFRILQSGVYNAKGSPVRAVRGKNAVARGPAPKEFMTFRYPAPKFDDLMRNPQVQAQLKEQNISVDEARVRYEQEAPREIEILTEVSQASNAKDTGKNERVTPQIRKLQKTPTRQIEPQPVKPQLDGSKLKLQQETTAIARPGVLAEAIPTTPEDLPDGPMAVEEFLSHVKRLAGQVERQPVALKSIDPNARIVLKGPSITAPQTVPAGELGAAEMAPDDRAEFEALQKQNFDPVLKRQ
jgi:hypothetical protein